MSGVRAACGEASGAGGWQCARARLAARNRDGCSGQRDATSATATRAQARGVQRARLMHAWRRWGSA